MIPIVKQYIPPGRIQARIRAKRHIELHGPKKQSRNLVKKTRILVGIDGEGKTISKGTKYERHIYTLLCVCDEQELFKYYVENVNGLSTIEIFEFLLSLPKDLQYFAYAFEYDLTKILEDLDNETLYKLYHPETRKNKRGNSQNVEWRGYKLNKMSGKTIIKKGTRKVVINDIIKFYQGKFISALSEWKAAPKEVIDRIEGMKNLRNSFVNETDEDIINYCFEECKYMAVLVRKLVEAHQSAGIPLTKYYGAGSSAEAMLTVMGIKDTISEYRRKPVTETKLLEAIHTGFFGGRFENSVIGTIHEDVNSWDISSAYPYQIYRLPCLLHGTWEHTTRHSDIINASTAIVRYVLHKPTSHKLWAPFPFRLADGSIVFPESSGGGWVWKDEFLAGEHLFPNVEFKEAYIYRTECECQPFKKIAEYYSERCRIGKEGPGIVLKLGCNSCYGKLAQSLGGQGKFTNWIWAGMITSGCRAQLLQMMSLFNDINSVLMVATDSVSSTEYVQSPIPIETGTTHTGKPLGGWEHKLYKGGMFYARPGVYFPVIDDISEANYKTVRARGIGREALLRYRHHIIGAFERGDSEIQLDTNERFWGVKSSIGKTLSEFTRNTRYGKWSKRPMVASFNPLPKRECIINGNQLQLRSFPDLTSLPYEKALLSEDAEECIEGRIIEEEQP